MWTPLTIFGAVSVGAALLYVVFGSPWKYEVVRGFPGLRNLGNTCFVNALLQALASCPVFVLWVKHHTMLTSNKTLLTALSDTLAMLSCEKLDADIVDPRPIIEALQDIGWVIPVTEEQDSHEFFHVLMSSLSDTDGQPQGLNGFASLCQLSTAPTVSWSHSYSIIQQRVTCCDPVVTSRSPFHGTLASCLVKSASLEKQPTKYDVFESVSVSVQRQSTQAAARLVGHNSSLQRFGVTTLEHCLQHYVQSEAVEIGSKELSASECQTTYVKQLTFGKLPECLAIHIQRTYWHASGIPFKDNTYIHFPYVLDMSPYVHNTTLSKRCYQLVSVICHVGDVFSGHFITYRRLKLNPSVNDPSVPSRWLYTSDTVVRPASQEEVTSATAYMLFYERMPNKHNSL